MNKNWSMHFVVVVIMSALMCMTTGCGNDYFDFITTENINGDKNISVCNEKVTNDREMEINLAVIAGVRSNTVSIPLKSQSINNAIYNSCYTYGSVAFVNVDANPQIFYQTDIPQPEKKGLSTNKKISIANGYKNQLINELMKSTPNTPEADLLKAITQASYALKSSSSDAKKVLVIMDSGLSTCGYVDFTKELLNANSDEIVRALNDAKALPDLSGVEVIWMFSGQTVSPQKELSEIQKSKLKDIWEKIIIASGADVIEFTCDVSSEIAGEVYPNVSTVDVGEREIEVSKTEVEEQIFITIPEPIETVVLDNASVSFIGDKAIFVDESMANQVIGEYAGLLLENPNNKVYVVGTTATGEESFCNQLSKDRAQAVCNVLISYGVPQENLIPVGLGYSDFWHIPDLDDTGHQIEEIACQNRKVLIMDVNGPDAKHLN